MPVSSSGVDKSAYSATTDPGSIGVLQRAIARALAGVPCGEHLG